MMIRLLKRLLAVCMLCVLSVPLCAQKALWVGETYQCDVTSSIMGTVTDMTWSVNGGYLNLSGSGYYRNVKATQYFGGTATVKVQWRYRFGSGPQYNMSRSWTFTCNENPVSIHPTSLTLAPGQEAYLSYSLKYTNAYSSYAEAYFSCGSSVVTVSESGHVVANKEGTAYVNVYSKVSDASKSPYCVITVKNINPTSVSVNEAITIREGETFKLTAKAYPDGATTGFTWTSDNPEAATVSSDGVVTAVKKGQANITVTTTVGGYTDACKVTVKEPPVPPTAVTIKEKVSLYKGFSTVLVPALEPPVAETEYKWSSSDPTVASVSSSGKITAVNVGTAVITVKTSNGMTASSEVTVSEVPDHIDASKLKSRMSMLEGLAKESLKYIE